MLYLLKLGTVFDRGLIFGKQIEECILKIDDLSNPILNRIKDVAAKDQREIASREPK